MCIRDSLGMHVAIKPGRTHWMLALEVMFGRFSGLSAFCVESHADEKAFRALFADRTDATARLAKQVRVVVSPSDVRVCTHAVCMIALLNRGHLL